MLQSRCYEWSCVEENKSLESLCMAAEDGRWRKAKEKDKHAPLMWSPIRPPTRDNLRTGFRSHTVVTRDLRVHAVWDDGDNDDDGDVYPRKAVDLD